MVAGFDLFYLFVENVFGGILAAGVGIAGLLFLIGVLGRMSFISVTTIVGLFLLTFAVGYVGGFATLIVGTLAMFYFFRGLINFIGALG